MTFLEIVKKVVEDSAGIPDYMRADYAKDQINDMSNFEFLELLSEALETPEAHERAQ